MTKSLEELLKELDDISNQSLETADTAWKPPKPKSFWTPETVSQQEIKQIADKHGIDPEFVQEATDWYAGVREFNDKETASDAVVSTIKATAGHLGNAVLLGMPQWLYKKLIADTSEAKAMEEVQELVEKNKSAAQIGLEFVAPTLGAGAFAKAGKVAGGAAYGATLGGAASLARSKEGQELEAAAQGIVLGAMLGGALPAVGKGSSWLYNKSLKRLSEQKNKLYEEVQKVLAKEPEAKAKASRDFVTNPEKIQTRDEFLKNYSEVADAYVGKPNAKKVAYVVGKLPEAEKALALKEIAWGRAQNEVIEFATFLKSPSALKATHKTGLKHKKIKSYEEAVKVIDQAKREGQEHVEFLYQKHKEQKATLEYIRKNRKELYKSGLPAKYLESVGDFFSDAQFVTAGFDRKWGTGAERYLSDMTDGYSRYTNQMGVIQEDIQKIVKDAIKLEPGSRTRIYKALDGTLEANRLTTSEAKIFQELRDMLDAGVALANELKLPIPKIENYVPHMAADPIHYIRAVNGRLKELPARGINVDGMSTAAFKKLQKENVWFSELTDALKLGSGKHVGNPNDFFEAIVRLKSANTVRSRLGTNARAAFQREGEIPEFVRELDPIIATQRWYSNTLRHIHMREPVRELEALIPVYRRLGDNHAAGYVERLLKSVNGEDTGPLDRLAKDVYMTFKLKSDEQVQRLLDSGHTLTAKAVNAAAQAPEVLDLFMRSMYPNLLGMNVRAMTRNLTQPFVLTAPEIGGAYGQRLAFSGIANTINRKRSGKSLEKFLQEKGMLPKKFTGEHKQFISEGMQAGSIYKLSEEALEKYSNMMLYAYGKTDVINRAVTYGMAERLVDDYYKGVTRARNVIDKQISEGFQQKIRRAKSQEELTDIVATYFLNRTQFRYNKTAMSEFGRWAGSYVSVFTKWPAAVLGDVIDKLRTQGVVLGSAKIGTKYMGPWASLYLFDSIFGDELQSEARWKKFAGPGGLRSWSPIQSLNAFAEGNIAKPPVVKFTGDVIRDIIRRDPKQFVNTMQRGAETFVPGGGLYRFITEDFPMIILNEEPKREKK